MSPNRELCLDVEPGYHQFSGRCVELKDHKGDHAATSKMYGALLPAHTWPQQ